MVFVMTSFLLSSLPTRVQFHYGTLFPFSKHEPIELLHEQLPVTQRSPMNSFSSSLRFTKPFSLHTPSWTTHQNWWALRADPPSPGLLLSFSHQLNLLIISLLCFHLCCFPIKYCEIQSSIPEYQDQCWHKEPINNTCYWSFCFISILAYNYSVSFLEKMINRSVSITKRDKSQLPTPRHHHRYQLLGLLKPH